MEATTVDGTMVGAAAARGTPEARRAAAEAVAAAVAAGGSLAREQFEDGAEFGHRVCDALERRGWIPCHGEGTCRAATFECVVASPDGARAAREGRWAR